MLIATLAKAAPEIRNSFLKKMFPHRDLASETAAPEVHAPGSQKKKKKKKTQIKNSKRKDPKKKSTQNLINKKTTKFEEKTTHKKPSGKKQISSLFFFLLHRSKCALRWKRDCAIDDALRYGRQVLVQRTSVPSPQNKKKKKKKKRRKILSKILFVEEALCLRSYF